jgi:hypothetical protein
VLSGAKIIGVDQTVDFRTLHRPILSAQATSRRTASAIRPASGR